MHPVVPERSRARRLSRSLKWRHGRREYQSQLGRRVAREVKELLLVINIVSARDDPAVGGRRGAERVACYDSVGQPVKDARTTTNTRIEQRPRFHLPHSTHANATPSIDARDMAPQQPHYLRRQRVLWRRQGRSLSSPVRPATSRWTSPVHSPRPPCIPCGVVVSRDLASKFTGSHTSSISTSHGQIPQGPTLVWFQVTAARAHPTSSRGPIIAPFAPCTTSRDSKDPA